jgi:hypothetical protein
MGSFGNPSNSDFDYKTLATSGHLSNLDRNSIGNKVNIIEKIGNFS